MSRTLRKNYFGKIYKDKDRRKIKASRGCLHHGGCPYCESNRLHNDRVRRLETKMQIEGKSE
jgi:hypothetical protein